jgi:monomeric isocitrate dehydrogenase
MRKCALSISAILSGSNPEVLKADLKLQAGEVIDASTMSRNQFLTLDFFFN